MQVWDGIKFLKKYKFVKDHLFITCDCAHKPNVHLIDNESS